MGSTAGMAAPRTRNHDLPFWNINVPEDQQTAECPEFLRELSAKDVSILKTWDEDYPIMTWSDVQKVYQNNTLDDFMRLPSDLRRYRYFIWCIKSKYGSVMDFLLTERLQWPPSPKPKGRPFEFDEDIKILYNDWPYGIDKRIVHLVVWTKFAFEEEPGTERLTDETRNQINEFVDKTFCARLPPNQVIWFRNWSSLKSIEALEHLHVMLFDPDPSFVHDITDGDVPLCDKQDDHGL